MKRHSTEVKYRTAPGSEEKTSERVNGVVCGLGRILAGWVEVRESAGMGNPWSATGGETDGEMLDDGKSPGMGT